MTYECETDGKMDAKRQKRISKFLSLVLRHHPQLIGIELDAQGWTPVEDLLRKAHRQGTRFSEAELRQVVADSDKKRFALSEDGQRIRANQGHSVAVDLALEPATPPEVLYHGTVARFWSRFAGKVCSKAEGITCISPRMKPPPRTWVPVAAKR